MKLCVCALLLAMPIAFVTSTENEPKSVCRDYLRVQDVFPSGTSCLSDNLPTYHDLVLADITMSTADFLEQHCCAFGGGDRIFEDDLVFEQLRKVTGMSVSDFQDQHSSSQKALFWLVKEDSYPNLEDYLHIGQRFALSSIYFGLNGDLNWLECSDQADTTTCSVPNSKSAWMSGVQECEWAYLTCDRNLFVTEIIMPSNVATAVEKVPIISSDIGLLGESLEKVNLRNNRIGGTIPNSIGSLILLTSFDVSYNNLQGELPNIFFSTATGLEVLRVGHNSLTGTIPDLSLSQLRELNLSFNNFTGNMINVFIDVPKLANVGLLATSFAGVFPIDVCNRSIVDPSSTVRLECPLNCDSALDNMTIDSDATNGCGGFGSTCSDYNDWVDSSGYECDWYETYDSPGCARFGYSYPNEDNITANDACCYCGGGDIECTTCLITTDDECTNDDEWTAIDGNNTISCDWFEENDEPGCANTYLQFLIMDNVSDPRESCCYCSQYGCQDVYGWHDVRLYDDYDDDGHGGVGRGCDWYEEWDDPGCPKYGDEWPDNDDGITAREACCYCHGYNPDAAPPACYDYNGWVDSWGNGCDGYEYNEDPGCPEYGYSYPNEDNITAKDACCYCGGGGSMNIPSAFPSHQYEPSVIPTVTCYDYNGWVDYYGDGCDWYEKSDDPGCPWYGEEWPNEDGITANDSCCYCGGGGSMNIPSASPSHQYKPTVTPSVTPSTKPSHPYEPSVKPTVTCYDYHGWFDYWGDGCDWYEDNDDPGCPYDGDWYPNEDGITGNDACCYCGGGSMTIPSASPSNKYKPTVTPSITYTNKPSYPYESTVTPSTPACYDYIGWVDYFGEECYYYNTYDDPDCPIYGPFYPNEDGILAIEACCHCGGGWFDINKEDDVSEECNDNDAHWQNIASTKYIPGSHQSCDELEYYISILNSQTDNDVDLTQFYCNDLNNGTVFMKDVCCICNSNQNDDPIIDDDTNDDDDERSCIDIQIPKPWPQRNCEWFARDASRCEVFGNSTILIEGNSNVPARYANEVCCVCGGGTRKCLEFNNYWMDSHPDEPFNCSQYDSEERCAADGSGLISSGHNANTQCCICGGGYTFKNDNVVANATNQTCLDESDWQSNGFTCSSFVDELGVPDVEQCLALGHITSIHGVNATEGCCDCWYGYDADTGGGYQGILLGKMFRIGMMNYTDLDYVHNVTSSGNVEEDSTLYEFVRNASEFYGFGLVHYDMNELIKARGLGRISNDTYYACLDALSLSLVDVCIGPYKNSTFPPGTKSIKGLYTEEYILVVRMYQLKLLQYVLLPFAPFDYKAWLLVTFTLLFLTCMHRWFALGLLQSHPSNLSDNSHQEDPPKSSYMNRLQYFLKKGVSVFFYFFTSFATGTVDTEMEDNDSTPASNIYVEKIIVVAISVFLFFTLILYGGSTAAEFVNNPQGPEFKTIHDVFANGKKVCFHDSLYSIIERDYPTNVDNFRNSSISDTERLINLQSNVECDSMVISRYSLSFISTQIHSSCDNLYPLYNNDLFTQEVIVAVSQTLGELGDELINVMDTMASKNLYRDSHDHSTTIFAEGCEFQALNDRKGVAWKALFSPLVFSGALAVVAIIVGYMKYKNGQKSMQSESCSPQCTAEPEEELALLLDNGNDLNKFSSEVKRLNEESEERITERIIKRVETSIMKRITLDNEHAIKQIAYDNNCTIKRITDDNKCVIKRITDDNECAMKQITECIERSSKHHKPNE